MDWSDWLKRKCTLIWLSAKIKGSPGSLFGESFTIFVSSSNVTVVTDVTSVLAAAVFFC